MGPLNQAYNLRQTQNIFESFVELPSHVAKIGAFEYQSLWLFDVDIVKAHPFGIEEFGIE
jgi:hypothetical protein